MDSDRSTLLVTRPRIAAELVRLGHPFKVIPHPWKEGMTAWIFPLSDKLKADAVYVYTTMAAPIPSILYDNTDDQQTEDQEANR